MNRLLSLCLLGTLGTAALSACDYNNTPGKNTQFSQDFTDAPRATDADTDLDSVSQSQDAYTPIGKGSPADQKTSVNSALEANQGNSPASTMPASNPEAKASTREN